jgi:hypothetical protein
MAWDRLCGRVKSVEQLLATTDPGQAWQHIDVAVRDLRTKVAEDVYSTIAAVRDRRDPIAQGSARYEKRLKKEIARRANQDAFYAEQYVKDGGTPEKDAKITWSRLKADVRKLEREEISSVRIWQRVRLDVDALCADVTAMLATMVAKVEQQPSVVARRRVWVSPTAWIVAVWGWLSRISRST